VETLSVDALCDLAEKDLGQHKWETAEKLFQEALSVKANAKRALLGSAIIARRDHFDYEQAQRFLNRCLYYYPHDPEVLTEQGSLYAEQGDHVKAIVSFDQALAQSASKREALQGKVRSLIAQGKAAEAQQLIESFAPTVPRPSWLLLELWEVHIARAAYDQAVEAFLDAGDSDALYRALRDQSEKSAKDALSAAIMARQPGNPKALRAVAQAHAAFGDVDLSIELLSQGGRLMPCKPSACPKSDYLERFCRKFFV
jgi:tetratricopeptide (TPR) repeat protein